MKTYVIVTGALFGLVTLAHVWRMFEERPMAGAPWYILITLGTAGMAVWAWSLARRDRRTP